MKIIFLSNQLFDFPLRTNKWHVATRVAERGHQVLFVDPPLRFRKVVRQIIQHRWSPTRLLSGSYRTSSLTVFTPFSRAVSEAPDLVDLNIWRMKRQFPEFFRGDAVLWVYNPAMDKYMERIPYKLLVYDCVDEYPAMANYVRRGLAMEIARKEEKIARRADVVFATTERLAAKLSRYNSNVYYVGNAGDYRRFSPVGHWRLKFFEQLRDRSSIPSVPFHYPSGSMMRRIPRPRIGFTGAIDEYKLDLSLLAKAAETYPDYSFVVVGPQAVADTQPDLSELKELANVYLVGPRSYEEMPGFFADFDAYLIPYRLNDYTLKGCFPVKFLDSLAAGLPTIVTNLPSYARFAEVCYIGKSDIEFTEAISRSLEEDCREKIEARMKIARENSWEAKVERMLGKIRLLL